MGKALHHKSAVMTACWFLTGAELISLIKIAIQAQTQCLPRACKQMSVHHKGTAKALATHLIAKGRNVRHAGCTVDLLTSKGADDHIRHGGIHCVKSDWTTGVFFRNRST